MSIGKFFQVVCVWCVTAVYSIAGYLCVKSGGIVTIMGAFFLFAGIVQAVKLFNGSILKSSSH